ncbi:PRC-barrel domain-containing protein [Aestuariibius sp. 2305UL40-4]|uniref:PRC-barrel domain-containing protein n=1 Tax=Aestuariibius violaceus TaxID=3234132 RepID=UPI00345ED27C
MKYSIAVIAATLTAGSAIAETQMDTENLIRTRDITGGDIYTMNVEADDAMWGDDDAFAEIDAEWNDIGEIEDVILSRDGQMIGIVAEIGGFLDIGDKHVMIPVEDVKLVPVDDQTYAYVTRMTEEQLEEMESVDEGWWN